MKNKLFFFGAWEGQYQKTPQQFFFNVPPDGAAGRRLQPGVQPRRQPADHLRPDQPAIRTAPGATPFPGNVIPADTIERHRQKIQALYPTAEPAGRALQRQRRRRRRSSATTCASRTGSSIATTTTSRSNYNLSASSADLGQVLADGRQRHFAAGLSRLRRRAHRRHHGADVHRSATRGRSTRRWCFDATFGISKMNHDSQESDLALGNFGLDDARHPRDERRRELQQRPALRRHPASSSGRLLVQLRHRRQRQRVGSGGARRADLRVLPAT